MNVFETNNRQLSILLYSAVVGVAVGVIYTLLCVTYDMCVGKRKNIFFRICLDLLFSAMYTLIAVLFVYAANSGKIRVYILFFSVLSFALYQLTAGKLLYRLLMLMLGGTIKALSALFAFLLKPFSALLCIAVRYFKRKRRKKKLLGLIKEGII